MNFVIESKKDITIFRLQEKRLDASLAPELKSQVLMLVAEGKKYLIIDLAQVDAIDSSGIGALLIAHRHTAEMEGFAAFIGVHGNVKDLLQMMQLHKQLYIFSSVQEVLRNLEEVDDTEDAKVKKGDDDDEEIDALAELDEVVLPGEDGLELGAGDLDVPEFPDESIAEFSDDDDKPKKRGKSKRAPKAKSTKTTKKSAPKAKAKKK
ncbi:MAG: STAS domain-containing protein [Chloroherpetonaceae bacterium]